MPSIQIVSVNAESPVVNPDSVGLSVRERPSCSNGSARIPEGLLSRGGVQVQLGNPKMPGAQSFFAGHLIDWSFAPDIIVLPGDEDEAPEADLEDRFRFREEFRDEAFAVIEACLNRSPLRRAVFVADYHAGPETEETQLTSWTDFRNMHDRAGLRWNALYEIRK